ncbi:MAG: Fur family transcriptional regulator [Woeseiaceae bacterium]|nr:Fur family transcriptional regulator [Woeseiaceae bacterium]
MAENPKPTALEQHDHDDCVDAALRTAERLCRDRGLRFTALRRRVLEIVWHSHRPVGAYDILGSLGQADRQPAPPTVYRALDFLIEAGLVHRLDSLNAFVGCADPGHMHTGQFLICRGCRTVIELDEPGIEALVEARAGALGFSDVRQILEIEGLCDSCRSDPGDA